MDVDVWQHLGFVRVIRLPVVYIYHVVVTVRVVARSSPFIEFLPANDVTGSLGVRVPVPYTFSVQTSSVMIG